MAHIYFGTESGNSEMAADDIAAVMKQLGRLARVVPMEEADVDELARQEFVVVVTSTYGDGELPETTQPFYNAMKVARPDLSGLRFAAFGLGDSTYETYGNGIDTVARLMVELGARQVGETGRHDAAKSEPLTNVALRWTHEVLPHLSIPASSELSQ
jgi:MioC protein